MVAVCWRSAAKPSAMSLAVYQFIWALRSGGLICSRAPSSVVPTGAASGVNDDVRYDQDMAKTSRPSGSSRGRRHHIVAVVVPGMSPLEIAVAAEFLGVERPELGHRWYRFTICTPEPGPVGLEGGMNLYVEHGLEWLRRADTVIVPGWAGRGRASNPAVIAALAEADRRGARMVSFCTGAFALAEAGVLTGRRATTHWSAADDLAHRYPEVTVDPDVLYIEDGDVLTSAGSAASIDCALALVRQDFGAEVANDLARDLVVAPHRQGGQAQFVAAPVPLDCGADPLAAVLDWAVEHLDEQLTITDLAARANLSPRQFSRRFRQVAGATPHQWLIDQRILLARRLLESTDLSIDRVADQAGFGSSAAMRLHFQRAVRTSPVSYRRVFSQAAS
jgi:AraC family transcriptional regulator, transcriptional activator FtrA